MKINRLSKLVKKLDLSLSIAEINEQVNALIGKGDKFFNYILGDFSPKYFPIPSLLKEEIIKSYQENNTNYPELGGMKKLKQAIVFVAKSFGALTDSKSYFSHVKMHLLIQKMRFQIQNVTFVKKCAPGKARGGSMR